MKVWEKCNELKGTNATKEQIASWAYMNRICPAKFEDELDLDGKYPNQMIKIAWDCCHSNKCGADCLDKFLDEDI